MEFLLKYRDFCSNWAWVEENNEVHTFVRSSIRLVREWHSLFFFYTARSMDLLLINRLFFSFLFMNVSKSNIINIGRYMDIGHEYLRVSTFELRVGRPRGLPNFRTSNILVLHCRTVCEQFADLYYTIKRGKFSDFLL